VAFMIPCHRIIAADGTLGGWGGDRWGDQTHRLRTKQELLLREGVTIAPRAG
jgi:methylated-DNA-[protein]-cysteine S-methyltransferase